MDKTPYWIDFIYTIKWFCMVLGKTKQLLGLLLTLHRNMSGVYYVKMYDVQYIMNLWLCIIYVKKENKEIIVKLTDFNTT